jgi:hypothetical protein
LLGALGTCFLIGIFVSITIRTMNLLFDWNICQYYNRLSMGNWHNILYLSRKDLSRYVDDSAYRPLEI